MRSQLYRSVLYFPGRIRRRLGLLSLFRFDEHGIDGTKHARFGNFEFVCLDIYSERKPITDRNKLVPSNSSRVVRF